jgi:hypothetical protein
MEIKWKSKKGHLEMEIIGNLKITLIFYNRLRLHFSQITVL